MRSLSLKSWTLGLAVAFALATASAAQAAVNLEWRTSPQVVPLGGNFSIGLYAVSDTGGNQSMSAVDAVLDWNPALLQLTGLTNDSPHAWGSSNFPNDCGLDGLNGNAVCPTYTGLSANDGSAFYRAQAVPGLPALATPAGLLVATFNFTALALTDSTMISIPPTAGLFTESMVVDGITGGLRITGLLGSAKITVVPEPASLALVAAGAMLLIRRRRVS